jgi:hypothetical protein
MSALTGYDHHHHHVTQSSHSINAINAMTGYDEVF